MIATREHLIHVLTEAAEIEHNLLCSYLYAVFSLKRDGEAGLTPAQGAAVERWRKSILGVCKQEMAHLAAVNNLLLAVGGAPHLDRPNFPVAPGYHPAGMVVRLTPFDRATLEHFIFLERPHHIPLDDAPGFAADGAERRPRRGAFTPSAHDYDTVGALYGAIADGFRRCAARLGEAALIDPAGVGQLNAEGARLDNVKPVTDLALAIEVISHIKEEGEGSQAGGEDSHFARFCSIRDEWDALETADGAFEPAWPAAHDPVMRKPALDVERVWITAEPAAAWLDLGNAVYGAMLQTLCLVFTGQDGARQARLLNVTVELMEAVGVIGSELARMPAADDHPGVNAGLSFVAPRSLGARPRATDATVAERIAELRKGAESVLDGPAAEKALVRLGNALGCLAQ